MSRTHTHNARRCSVTPLRARAIALALLAATAPLVLLTACGSTQHVAAQTRESQAATTPDQALASLREGNRRFVEGRPLRRDLNAQVRQTSGGQYPIASIVSCIDSRAPAELIFDQGIGDIFNTRIAGNAVNEDILGSLEFTTAAAGVRLIVVLGHTSCGAIKGAADGVELGNLTGLLAKLRPAVEDAAKSHPNATSKNPEFIDAVAVRNVRLSMRRIREMSPVIDEQIASGRVHLVGAVYDISTGVVTFLDL